MPADSRLEREVLAWSFFVASIAAFFVAYLTGHDTLRLMIKPLPAWSLALLVSTRRSGLARPVLVGLLIGSLGDIFLETGNPSHFVPGLLAFLFGHLAYIFGFGQEAPALSPLRALPFLGMVTLVMAITLPKAGPLAVPIGAYGLVIGVMMWRAAARVGGPAGAFAWVGLLGAALFAFSDSMIAVNRFVQPFEGARPLILVTYWAAQALVALSVPREETPALAVGR